MIMGTMMMATITDTCVTRMLDDKDFFWAEAYRDLLSKAEQQMRDHDINTNDYDFIVSYHFDFEKMNVVLRGQWIKRSSSIKLDLDE